jgi:hypothetical protein
MEAIMSYGRLISKDIINDPTFSEMSEGSQLWALKLLVLADDFGRGYGGQIYFRRALGLVHTSGSEEVDLRIKEITEHGIIEFYEHGSHKCHYFPHWFDIQRFNSNCHPKPTQIPNPPNPAKAYIKGCMKLCRVMLKKGAHDPDVYIDITGLFHEGWEDGDVRDESDQ